MYELRMSCQQLTRKLSVLGQDAIESILVSPSLITC